MSYLFCQVLTKKLKILFWQIRDVSFYHNCVSQYNLMLPKYAAWLNMGSHTKGDFVKLILFMLSVSRQNILSSYRRLGPSLSTTAIPSRDTHGELGVCGRNTISSKF